MSIEMSYKDQLLDTIATRASYPLEHLCHKTQGEQYTDTQSWPESESLQQLYHVMDATNEEQQARFLAHLRLDESQLQHALSLPASAEEVSGLAWINLLAHILSEYTYARSQKVMAHSRYFFPTDHLPFEELFFPFIDYAWQQVQSRVPSYASILNTKAQIQLKHWLLSQLTLLGGEPLWLDFLYFCTLDEHISVIDERQPQRVLYERFLGLYAGENFLVFFAEYSLLARLLIHSVEQWIEVCVEFLKRLQIDRDLIAHTFFADKPLGRVLNLQAGCSDRHHQGRSVFLLEFADERRLVYKPRCMKIDEAFSLCVQWLNENGLSPDLTCARILNRSAYGWMEYCEHRPCQTSAEVQSFFQRCGLLTCLFYVLGSTDMHHENIIAHGAYPIPIDLETLLFPQLRAFPTTHAIKEQKVRNSLHNSGILVSKVKLQGQEVDLATLGDLQVYTSPLPSPVWSNINTDAMTLSYEYARVTMIDTNKAIMDGKIVKTSDHLEDLVTGFRHMYHFLMEHREKIQERGGMLDFFANCPIRYVYRSTAIYMKQMRRLTSFKFLQDGAVRWIDLQIFKKPLLKEPMEQHWWAIASYEQAALERLDVPWFGTRTDSPHLYADEDIIAHDVFLHSALEQVRFYLTSLNDEDMEQQLQLIYDAYGIVERDLQPSG